MQFSWDCLGLERSAPTPDGDRYLKLDADHTPTTAHSSGWSSPGPNMLHKPPVPSSQSSTQLNQSGSVTKLVVQIFPPFLLAGLGMVAAGLLLGHVTKEFRVFADCREIVVLVPALLGLKGNLEMTLASRMSTHANLGDLDCSVWEISIGSHRCAKIISGNLMAVQSQAIVVGFLAAFVAIVVNIVSVGQWSYAHALLLCSSAVASASIASFVLAIIMIGIVLFAHRVGVDPDNVASPIAGMLGDFCTLALLAYIAQALWCMGDEWHWVQCAILGCYAFVAPLCAWRAQNNEFTSGVLREAWGPVISSMLMSSVGGLILKHGVHMLQQLAYFAPVMNGAGGNLAAVHTSRISTSLHEEARRFLATEDTEAPPKSMDYVGSPKSASSSTPPRAIHILVALIVPGSLCFCTIIVGVRSAWRSTPEPAFLLVFATAAIFQVLALVKTADIIVAYLWARGVDPDNAAIPYVTSLGDVLGAALLTSAFGVMAELGIQPWHGCCS